MAKWGTFKWSEEKWYAIVLNISTTLTLTPAFPAEAQYIVITVPSSGFLTEQARRTNAPFFLVLLFIDSTQRDITDKFKSMGPIDRAMTYKPGETKLLTISDQTLVMSNADKYFSDLNPSSPFYKRDYAGQDRIKVYAGFIISVGPDLTGNKTITALTTEAGFPASNATDDDDSTYWQCEENQVTNQWLKVDFGTGVTKTVIKVTLQCLSGWVIHNFRVEGSNNDIDWGTVYTGLMINNGNLQTFEFANAESYRYYRIFIIDAFDAQWIKVQEIELVESVPGGYSFVMQKADMKLLAIKLETKSGTAYLECQDSFREVFDIYVGLPNNDGSENDLDYTDERFRDIIEDLLIDKVGEGVLGYPDKVTDRGIEVWGDDDPTHWTRVGESAGERDTTKETSKFHWGAHAAKLEITGNDGTTLELTQVVNGGLVVGTTYEFQCWIYFPTRTAGTIRVKVVNTDGDWAVSDLAITNSKYIRYSKTFTPTQIANKIHLQFLNETTTGVVYFDDISIKQVESKIDIEDVDLEFSLITFSKKKISECIEKLSEVARGSTVILGDGTIQFRRFISEATDVDLTLRSGENYSRLEYIGKDIRLKVNKVVVIGVGGAGGEYAEAEIVGDTGITLKYDNDAILAGMAADIAAECLGRFAVEPAAVTVTGEYLPSLDIKSVVKVYEPNSMMNPKTMQIRRIALDIVGKTTRMLLSVPDACGRQKTWTSKTDWDGAVAISNLHCPLGVNRLEIQEPAMSGYAEYVHDMQEL